MKKYLFVAVILMFVLILGCSDQAVEEKPVLDAPAESQSSPSQDQITGAVAAEPEVEEQTDSAKDCTLLTEEEIDTVTRMNVLPESKLFEYSSSKCERKWSEEKEEDPAMVTLSVWIQTFSKTKSDLLKCYTFDSYDPIDDIGGHYACWYDSGKAVNFGKDKYKFQISCTGEGCSQANMIELAKIVVRKV